MSQGIKNSRLPCKQCASPSRAHGLCKRHYDWARRHGLLPITVLPPQLLESATTESATQRMRLHPPRTNPCSISPREEEVWKHRALGLTYKEIGKELSISEKTVQTHHDHLVHKLGLTHTGGIAAKLTRLWIARSGAALAVSAVASSSSSIAASSAVVDPGSCL